VPAPTSTKDESKSKNKAEGSNQKLMLLRRGKAMSTAPIIIGKIQLPRLPNKRGISIKKIIITA
jgi:hypothetical protein